MPFAIGLYFVPLGNLLWVTCYKRGWYTWAKALASLSFLIVAAVFWLAGPGAHDLVARAILAMALLVCAIGDVLLGLANRTGTLRARPFMAGAVFFLAAHLLFITQLLRMGGFQPWMLLLPAAGLAAMAVFEHKGLVRLKRMRLMAYVYTAVVTFMMACATGVIGAGPAGALLFIGAFGFLLSDIILLFLYFGVKRRKYLRYANLLSYYLGMLFIAGSVGFL